MFHLPDVTPELTVFRHGLFAEQPLLNSVSQSQLRLVKNSDWGLGISHFQGQMLEFKCFFSTFLMIVLLYCWKKKMVEHIVFCNVKWDMLWKYEVFKPKVN